MKETEITVQVFNEIAQIDAILKQQGFSMIENFQMTDWYFSGIGDVSDVSYEELMKNSFLVRSVCGEVKLCYKNKEIDKQGNVVAEEKITAHLTDLEKTLQVFKMAKLNNYCVVENNSFVYQKGEIAFVVQVIKDLGIFIEYEEDETMTGMRAEEKFLHMSNIVNSLGLNLGEDYSCKKVFMLLHKKEPSNNQPQ